MTKLRVAELNTEVEYKYPTMMKQAEFYKADFDKPNIRVAVSDESIAELKVENPHLTEDDLEYIFTGAGFYEALLDFNGFMLHSSGVCVDGYAYLFSADPGTGKSTHTGLWQQYFGEDRALIINDDKPAIRLVDDTLYAFGTPWSGKTDKNLNMRVPVGAIVFLERSVGNNWVKKITPKEAIPLIMGQTIRPTEQDKMIKLLDVLDTLLRRVKVYRLGCDMSFDAVKTSYEGIRADK
jgi:hypothetical protein